MFNNIDEFYPTPDSLIDKMIYKFDIHMVDTVLEPSAGSGAIADAITRRLKNTGRRQYDSKYKADIDTIEIDNNLQHIIKGKGYRLVHDDFLTYKTYKRYSLILMNPPFSNGDKHLLKAIEIQSQQGGKIVCILNAETIKNPYSNTRKDLNRKLEELNASIEYITDAFTLAERRTDVEVALIAIDISQPQKESIILTDLKQKIEKELITEQQQGIIRKDYLQNIVDQYNIELQAGIKLIREYEAVQPFILKSKSSSPILKLVVDGGYNNDRYLYVNDFVKLVRKKYWTSLFSNEEFTGKLTTNLQDEFQAKVEELVEYDFSMFNIKTIQIDMMDRMVKGVDETILALFEELSHKHSWYDETSKNIYLFNGWKTNKAWIINKKAIIPLSRYYERGESPYAYNSTYKKLGDIIKVFNYLDNGRTENLNNLQILHDACKNNITSKIQLQYITVTFYKKGTCHIEFRDADLLKKFNLFGCQKKGWLPPCYGKASYKEMTKEEQTVIDEFEGEAEYNRVLLQKDYFIHNSKNILMLEQNNITAEAV